jgi:hypothetical protein
MFALFAFSANQLTNGLSTDKINSRQKSVSFPFSDRAARPSGLISLYSSDGWASG